MKTQSNGWEDRYYMSYPKNRIMVFSKREAFEMSMFILLYCRYFNESILSVVLMINVSDKENILKWF